MKFKTLTTLKLTTFNLQINLETHYLNSSNLSNEIRIVTTKRLNGKNSKWELTRRWLHIWSDCWPIVFYCCMRLFFISVIYYFLLFLVITGEHSTLFLKAWNEYNWIWYLLIFRNLWVLFHCLPICPSQYFTKHYNNNLVNRRQSKLSCWCKLGITSIK